ncbi:methylated-DNA-protein-cysteine S-methyltransferase [Leifsonia xyli subsp. cynodontis DSM 46306]|jgi:methylated-DNA-[protein]-cysteine S-methyltransferase|uniref:methylated-DNA--[protein]-cysteine S-methyltransferase n=1 Tax=Leifsonia xyli subsp. cynodontis DSM 46306 TaxID=1389489 RepID=U3P9Q7_LEIXC|nr:methylated-DNA--[protein]-cysteine S-methyltransferase [Leifsonia xyli]AGW42571.1 methylated-DNA-protein-cysteine S-methyltransferase [Leifsonia xyli subsp. cynodontis DSM 46306]
MPEDPTPPSARHAVAATSIGELTLTARGDALTGVYFPGHWHPATAERLGDAVALDGDPALSRAAVELREYLAGERTAFDLHIQPIGDEFQLRVWACIERIPYGSTTTYAAIADELGDRRQAQRVGTAVGRNPLSIVIGCHRVLGSDGRLHGYAGGLERKALLLELERGGPADDQLF